MRAGLEYRAGAGRKGPLTAPRPRGAGADPSGRPFSSRAATWDLTAYPPHRSSGRQAPPLTAPRAAQREAQGPPEPGERRFPWVLSPAARRASPPAFTRSPSSGPSSATLRRTSAVAAEVAVARTVSVPSTKARATEPGERLYHSSGYLLLHTGFSPRPRTQAIGCWAPPHLSIGPKRMPLSHLEGHVRWLLA